MANTIEELRARWIHVSAEMKRLRAEEQELRNALLQFYFSEHPDEGTAKADGLKAKFGYTRNVQMDDLNKYAEEFQQQGMDLNALIKFKPSLDLKAYRSLTVDQQKSFDRCLVVKPSLPTLEVMDE